MKPILPEKSSHTPEQLEILNRLFDCRPTDDAIVAIQKSTTPEGVARRARMTHRQRILDPAIQEHFRFLGKRMDCLIDAYKKIKDVDLAQCPIAMHQAMRLPMEKKCDPIAQAEVEAILKTEGGLEESLSTLCYLLSRQYANPLWAIDRECAEALRDTEPRFDFITPDLFEKYLKLPFPSIYLVVPPVFSVMDEEGDTFQLEGIWLAEFRMIAVNNEELESLAHEDFFDTIRRFGFNRVLYVIGVGKARGVGVTPDGTPYVNDCLRTLHLNPRQGKTSWGIWDADLLARFVLNFLIALHCGYLGTQKVVPQKPKNPAKQQKRERRGEILEPHTLITLGHRAKRERDKANATGRTLRGHWVRSHWKSYWVRAPGDDAVLGEKPGKYAPLFRVARWIFTFKRGEGEPTSRNYDVRQPPSLPLNPFPGDESFPDDDPFPADEPDDVNPPQE